MKLNQSRRALLMGAASTMAWMGMAGPSQSRKARTSRTHADARDPMIEGLIEKMTVEEKAGQLCIYGDTTRSEFVDVNPATLALSLQQVKADIAAGKLTGVYNGIGVAGAIELQKVAVEHSRHKIPLIFAADVIHGLKTQFPIPLGEAASFDPDLAERTARATAVEATAKGLHWTFAPMVDIARDERWGRVCEGAGEDTYLGCAFAAARVRGFQGRSLKDEDSLLATPKHFAGYGAVLGGMEYNTVDIPETTLREVHLPPFKAAFDAGALTTMSAFNDIDGVPATGNHHLLTDILRGEWGFKGFVVSDDYADAKMIGHGFASDDADAVEKAIKAGCDMTIQSGLYMKHLPNLVRSGRVPMAVLDNAVRRVLYVKKTIGLFDNPFRSLDLKREQTDIRLPSTVALAREAAQKSIVLLKNENGLLPLKPATLTIALIGPFGSDDQDIMGPWAVFPDLKTGVSIEAGLREALPDPANLRVVKGCDVEAEISGGIEMAVSAAAKSDLVVLAVGEATNMAGEAQARTDIGLPPCQQALVDAIAATGKPFVLLLRHGRALALTGSLLNAKAILATWFLGSETGHAIADVLFGHVSPSGRLPVSFPIVSGQEPYFYNHRPTGSPHTATSQPRWDARYREVPFEALYPFGFGLTYSDIRYDAPTLSEASMAWNGTVTISARVQNIGSADVTEVAQLYIHDVVASRSQPVRALKGFKRVDLKAGESKNVSFTLKRPDLAFVHADLQSEAEPGVFEVWIAPSSRDGTAARFELKA